jgi:DNA-binding transcriptional ArsR family regulator
MSQPKSRELQTLEEIRELLSTYLGLFKAVNSKQINAVKDELLKTDVRKRIYQQCDGTKTVSEIAQILDPNKPITTTQPLVSYHLAILESNGLVSHKDARGQRYYVRVLE